MCPVNIMAQRENDSEAARMSRLDLISRIAIGVAHEIRNPLTVIKGYLQLVEKNPAYCTEELLSVVFQELYRIEDLITNFMLMARNKAIMKIPQNLNHILEKLYPQIRDYAVKHGIITELLLGDNVPLLDLNSEEMEQLVMNLVRNGIEAMRANSKLTVGTIGGPDSIILYVQDEGSGIPSEQIENIFDPFYTTKASNSGLGLAISLSIVERHQGKIEILSNVGVGTMIKVTFPVLGCLAG
ncbi:Sporulation kinase E [Sporomusa carbonis]|uniref:two-component system sensor histidine kinase NtrB n=1 Tax=Sporomusa carbonis TaxID=3076075 RepID=UPI003A744369